MMIPILADRNALRNIRRTLLTSATVVLSVALLTLAFSWIEGVFGDVFETSTASIGHVRVVDADYAERERLMPLYEHIADADAVVSKVAAVPGVVDAYPVIMTGVAVSGSAELGDAFGLAVGAPIGYIEERLKVDTFISDGSFFTGAADEVVLGRKLAAKAGATVGSEVLLVGQTQDGSISPIKGTVVGIASAGYGLVDQQAFVSLEKMQWLTDIGEGAIEVLVYGESFDDGEALAATIADLELDGLLVQAWSTREPWNQFTGMIGAIQGVFSAIFVFVSSLAIWNTMMMSVMERTSEIGVLRAMGLSRLATVVLFVLEALFIAALGGALGVALGAVPSLWLEADGLTFGGELMDKLGSGFAIQSTMYADFSFTIAVRAFLVGLSMALVGSFIPSLRAAAIQPVTAMSTGR